MNGDAICGFRISLYCATNARNSFYADPYHHMCSYHGVETDLLNLTACFGYELWRVSTTCTLVLESVKAGSVIFLLGVGSYVCYKLYRSYKRRCCPPDSPKRKISRWISKELLESNVNREEDVLDVKPEYFGPADQSDDNTSGSEFGGLPISFLPNSSYCLNKSIAEKLIHKISTKRMGHAHSTSRSNDSVSYNVNRGVNLFNKSSPSPVGLATIPSSSSPSPSIVCRNHHSQVNTPNDEKRQNPGKVQRPRSLPLHKTTRTSNQEADGSGDYVPNLSTPVKGRKQMDDDSSDSGESCHNWGSSKFYSDEEDNNGDGDDEGEDDEDCLDLSNFNLHKENDQGSCSGSLKGNFSPGSLLNRHMDMFSGDDRLLPDGTGDVTLEENALSNRKKVFVIESSNSVSLEDDDDDSCSPKLEKRDINYKDTHLALDLDSAKTAALISPHRLVRDFSFGSELSELSVDTSAFNEVGRSTEAKINRIQKEIDDMKRDFQDMESHIGSVDFHGPIPMAYTELVKSTLSDISECSDGPACESPSWSHGGKSPVDQFKKRTVSKETPHENLTSCNKQLNFRSCESSFDQSSTSSSSQLVNSSANQSFEWDSMKCGSNNNSNASIRLRKRWALSNGPINSSMISNNSMAQVDSGSDFGTPLTNGSPEPTHRGRSGSVISLEWEEEFDPPTSAEADNFSPSSLPGRKEISGLHQQFFQDEESLVSPSNYYANENNHERHMADSTHNESTSKPTNNGRHMWSSIESGYIDEFVESSGSCQITPMKDDDHQMSGNSKWILDIRKHPNTDSAYFEGVLAEAEHVRTWPVVEKKEEIKEQDGLSKEFVRQCKRLGFHHIRPIYKDGHSVFRAVLLQMLSQGYSPLVHSGGLDQVKRKFSLWMRCHHPWLSKWQFAPKLNYSQENCLQGMLDSLQTLDWLINCVLNSTNKEQTIVDMLNMDPESEMQAMEACKLLIMKSVVELYDDLKVDKTVPVFALILFARESSMDPESYMCNHLSCIWDAGGPAEMDLFFLSHAMGVAICVLHPGNNYQDDMITYHPDDRIGSWPEIHLVFKKEKKQYCTILR